jgi:hypothetical protein
MILDAFHRGCHPESGIRPTPPSAARLFFPIEIGRTSAPCWPQAWQVNSVSMSDSWTLSDYRSALKVVQWLQ